MEDCYSSGGKGEGAAGELGEEGRECIMGLGDSSGGMEKGQPGNWGRGMMSISWGRVIVGWEGENGMGQGN